MRAVVFGFLILLTAAVSAAAAAPDPDRPAAGVEAAPSAPVVAPADAVAAAIADEAERGVVAEVLRRNPGLAAAAARARAAERLPPQARAWPDPMAMVTAFLQTPETRVGPQEVMVGLSQSLPWFGKLGLRERAAVYEAAAVRAELEAERLAVVTEARHLLHELAFLAARERILQVDRATLEHYEELARTRYASGVGLQQAIIKIQAEITKDDVRLLEIADRRATLVVAVNALRDLPPDTPVPAAELTHTTVALDATAMRARALSARPEMVRAVAEIGRADTVAALAAKEYRPDVTLGLTYTRVARRDDAAGRANPPPDSGQDILGLSAAVNLPVRRAKLAAGVAEAAERRAAAGDSKRAAAAEIDRALGELVARIPLIRDQLRLFEDVLTVQAEESLRSAEAGYAAGSLDALDLLDAERVLLEVRTAAARTRADQAIALAGLEGVVAGPLTQLDPHGEPLP